MRYVEVAGERVSAIGLGTWQFGTTDWGYGLAYADIVAPALVQRALELGVTLIDTAEVYGGGESERIVGRALREAPGTAFVATKLNPILPIPPLMVRRAAASRERLGIPVIDLYQIHWPNPIVPLGLQAAGLREVLDRGIARQVGVSNHSLGRWQSMERALGRPVLSNQVEFSLARPGPARAMVPYAQANDRLVIAFSPLGQGLLASMDRQRPNPARRLRRFLGATGARDASGLRAIVSEIGAAHDATMGQVALAWLISHPNVVAIPGARTVEQLESNVLAANLELRPDERTMLTEAARRLEQARGR
jgi:aryl-alcohol dehydrogenase-like predicted oxidoreductase